MNLELAYQAEAGALYGFLRRLGASDVEDLVHDTFMVALARQNDYDEARSLRSWLLGIALGLWRNRRVKASSVNEVLTTGPDVTDDGAPPDETLANKQLRAELRATLERIDADQRVAFVWHDIEERPISELAAALGVPLDTVYSRLRLARKKVNEAFADRMRGGAK